MTQNSPFVEALQFPLIVSLLLQCKQLKSKGFAGAKKPKGNQQNSRGPWVVCLFKS